jgi:hypothetical protein
VLLIRAVDRLASCQRLLDGNAIALAMSEESGEGGPASAIAEIALTALRRMDKIERDIETYRHALSE